MTTKIYQLINSLSLRTCVTVAGKQVGIRFEGGACDSSGRIIRPGSLTTSDAKLQAAIEADTQYGGVFQLREERSDKNTAEDGNANGNDDPNLGGDPNSDKEQVSGVTNTQSAMEWLTANKGVDFKDNPKPKAAEVKAMAAELGVAFTEWK